MATLGYSREARERSLSALAAAVSAPYRSGPAIRSSRRSRSAGFTPRCGDSTALYSLSMGWRRSS